MSAKDKAHLRKLLEARDLQGVYQWTRTGRRALSTLFSLTYEEDRLIVWRAIEASGVAAFAKQSSNMEQIRDFIRRLIWLMNDESGGLGWRAPEVMGEILASVPGLIPEYAPLLPHYFEEEPFERGSVHAVGRVGVLHPEVVRQVGDTLLKKLCDSDPFIRVHALLALRGAGCDIPESHRQRLLADPASVVLYNFETGNLEDRSVAAFLRHSFPWHPPDWSVRLS